MIRLTRAQVREVDRRAIEEFGIPGIVLMENAARGGADEAMRMLSGIPSPRVVTFCGTGNNGGDGFAIARHLHNRGANVEVVLAEIGAMTADCQTNFDIVRRMNLPISRRCNHDFRASCTAADLVIDALFGTGLKRPITSPLDRLVDAMRGMQVLAVDIPSGLDCDTGKPLGDHCVRATRTVTFVAQKAGFAEPDSRQFTGEVIVADIGAPREIVDAVLRER